MRFGCQLASIFLPKIHQNPFKNRSQDASLFRLIFAWIFRRTSGRQDRQDGPKRPPRRPKRPPRRPQEGPEKAGAPFIFRYWPPRASKGPPGPLQDWFLTMFWLNCWRMFGLLLVNVWSIFAWFLIHFLIDFWNEFSFSSLSFSASLSLSLHKPDGLS